MEPEGVPHFYAVSNSYGSQARKIALVKKEGECLATVCIPPAFRFLGNVRRAIECRIDSFLCVYCLQKKSEKEKWDFPKKIEIIEQIGIAAPSILKRINKKRNELEDRYVKPTKEEVDERRDVAELFLACAIVWVAETTTFFLV